MTAPGVSSVPAIATHGLGKRFGDFVAVDDVSLEVPAGSLYGFLGPNGAGKSTTIRCLTGLLRPSAGTVRILGLDPVADPVAVKRRIGVVPEDLALFDRLSGGENLAFVARVHGLDRATAAGRIGELLELLDLLEAEGALVADYSHGMRRKLSLAMALLPAPRVLFLDEPFEGIDALVARQIRSLLQAFVRGGGTIFLTSHVLEIVERVCDRIGILARGRLVLQGRLDELGGAETAFLRALGAGPAEERVLDWLSG